MQVKTEMKRKVRKESGEESKKRQKNEVVVQGLEERFVDRNGMALFGVMNPSSDSQS